MKLGFMPFIVKRAVVVGDDSKVRPMMYVALSYDHRMVDGRESASFLVAVKERLEAPIACCSRYKMLLCANCQLIS